MRKSVWVLMVCLAGSLASAADAPPDANSNGITDNQILIGMSAALTGPSRGLGIELYRGAQAYFDMVNASGGIHGRKVALKVYDDAYDPTLTIDNTIRLLEDDKVFLLFNYVGTPTVTRMLPLLMRDEKNASFLFCPFTGAQTLREPPYDGFVFNLRGSYREETQGLVDHFLESGKSRIAVFYQADAYGRSGWDGVTRALAKKGLRICGEATYKRGTDYASSMKEQVRIMRESRPDAVVCVGAYAACAAFIRDARDANWNVPIANVSFVGIDSLMKILIDAGRSSGMDYTLNLINSQVVPSYENPALPGVTEYRKLMAQYAPALPEQLAKDNYAPIPFSYVSFEGFLNAKLLTEVLNRLGPNPQRSQLKAAAEQIQNLDLGIGSQISFNIGVHQALHTIFYTTIKDSKLSPIADAQDWKTVAP